MNVALFGATGYVGGYILHNLVKNNYHPIIQLRHGSESKITIDNLFLVASSKSAGKKIKFKNKEIEIEDLMYPFIVPQSKYLPAKLWPTNL